MKSLVRVIKMAGETGLRKPGTLYHELTGRAKMLEKLGLVQIIKEEKTPYETKEEKHKPKTKRK